jgi:hypothetical protein
MPVAYIDIPTGVHDGAKKKIFKEMYEAIHGAWPIPDTRVLIREWANEAVSQDGRIENVPMRPICTLAVPPGRHSPQPPSPGFEDPAGSSPPPRRTGAHRNPAHIRRIRAGGIFKRRQTPVPRVYLPVLLTAPGPSGSTEPARLCRGCSHPPRRPPE